MNTFPAPYAPVGVQTANSSLSASVPITVPATATGMLVQALTQNVRVIIDGATTPTATLGFQIKAGDPTALIPVVPAQVIRFIEETASASLQYQFVRTVQTVR